MKDNNNDNKQPPPIMQEKDLMSFPSKNQKQHLMAFHRIIQMIHITNFMGQ
jgi:hypothetical protein